MEAGCAAASICIPVASIGSAVSVTKFRTFFALQCKVTFEKRGYARLIQLIWRRAPASRRLGDREPGRRTCDRGCRAPRRSAGESYSIRGWLHPSIGLPRPGFAVIALPVTTRAAKAPRRKQRRLTQPRRPVSTNVHSLIARLHIARLCMPLQGQPADGPGTGATGWPGDRVARGPATRRRRRDAGRARRSGAPVEASRQIAADRSFACPESTSDLGNVVAPHVERPGAVRVALRSARLPALVHALALRQCDAGPLTIGAKF